MTTLAARREELHAAMVDAATDPGRLLDLQTGLRAVESELAEIEDRWLELSVD